MYFCFLQENLVTLLSELREAFSPLGLILSASVAENPIVIDASYDALGIAVNVDFMNMITSEYHGVWENFTHHDSPLCGYPLDPEQNNVVRMYTVSRDYLQIPIFLLLS